MKGSFMLKKTISILIALLTWPHAGFSVGEFEVCSASVAKTFGVTTQNAGGICIWSPILMKQCMEEHHDPLRNDDFAEVSQFCLEFLQKENKKKKGQPFVPVVQEEMNNEGL
jgi:hypothetical protein